VVTACRIVPAGTMQLSGRLYSNIAGYTPIACLGHESVPWSLPVGLFLREQCSCPAGCIAISQATLLLLVWFTRAFRGHRLSHCSCGNNAAVWQAVRQYRRLHSYRLCGSRERSVVTACRIVPAGTMQLSGRLYGNIAGYTPIACVVHESAPLSPPVALFPREQCSCLAGNPAVKTVTSSATFSNRCLYIVLSVLESTGSTS
jgi:hypothetical protein